MQTLPRSARTLCSMVAMPVSLAENGSCYEGGGNCGEYAYSENAPWRVIYTFYATLTNTITTYKLTGYLNLQLQDNKR